MNIEQANATATERMMEAHPVLVGLEFHFAFMADPQAGWNFTSNSIGVRLDP